MLHIFLLSDVGYSYGQDITAKEGVQITIPAAFLTYEGGFWFWFSKNGYRNTNPARTSKPESFTTTLKPQEVHKNSSEIIIKAEFKVHMMDSSDQKA